MKLGNLFLLILNKISLAANRSFTLKKNIDGTIDWYKVYLVVKSLHEWPKVDFTKIFSPMVIPTIIQIVVTIALSHMWFPRQLNVNNVFQNVAIFEEVYMKQPCFIDTTNPSHVYISKRAFYNLNNASQAWYDTLWTFLLHHGFTNYKVDGSFFINDHDGV